MVLWTLYTRFILRLLALMFVFGAEPPRPYALELIYTRLA